MDRGCSRASPPHRCFPRRRGDGPQTVDDPGANATFPPQARGWTTPRRAEPSRMLVSPAGAGMDRGLRPGGRVPGCFPRRRGDGPLMIVCGRIEGAFPPQARGWTHRMPGGQRRQLVSPAGAGMDLRRIAGTLSARCFPRRRGDGPSESLPAFAAISFPPQARGWTSKASRNPPAASVSPAGAGMDHGWACRSERHRGFPRRRGDGPLALRHLALRREFPPQARGWTADHRCRVDGRRVSPAGAGMDPGRAC